jgi:hypothetical protein
MPKTTRSASASSFRRHARQFLSRDPESYERIRDEFVYWDDAAIHYKGHELRCAGNDFCGMSRVGLLNVLQEHRREVDIEPATFATQFPDSDIIVAADGIRSSNCPNYLIGKGRYGSRCLPAERSALVTDDVAPSLISIGSSLDGGFLAQRPAFNVPYRGSQLTQLRVTQYTNRCVRRDTKLRGH